MVAGFRETLRADINIGRYQPPGEKKEDMNLVIVSHGLTLRVFLMRWYKWTVEQFERLNNLGNGNMLVMGKGYGGRYCSSLFCFSFPNPIISTLTMSQSHSSFIHYYLLIGIAY